MSKPSHSGPNWNNKIKKRKLICIPTLCAIHMKSIISAPSKMHWRGLRKPPYYTGLANISIDKF